MPTETQKIEELASQEYKYGFYTDVETDSVPAGLNEEIIRTISEKKGEPEFMLEWRLKAYRHWLTMEEPHWANVTYPPIDYQSIIYYSAPKSRQDGPQSLDEVAPEILETYKKLGIRSRNRRFLLEWPWMPFSTASRWQPPSRRNLPIWESYSAPSRRR
jgi:Fe-S cluster assembly protein SufB